MCNCGTKAKVDVNNSVTDVVCGMQIDPGTAEGMSEYNGKRYFFCGAGCKEEFDAAPAAFADAAVTA